MGILGSLLIYLVQFFLSLIKTSTWGESALTALYVFSPFAMMQSGSAIVTYESYQTGLNFDNLFMLYQKKRVGVAMLFFVIDALVFTLLTLYLDQVSCLDPDSF